MNKNDLLSHILVKLESVHQDAIDAARRAHQTATDKENVAENKYDTLGLEASYLAQGQAKRVDECERDVIAFKKLLPLDDSQPTAIGVGSLVVLQQEDDSLGAKLPTSQQYLFLGPTAGGLKVNFLDKEIIIITPTSPLGKTLLGKHIHEQFELQTGNQKNLSIINNIY